MVVADEIFAANHSIHDPHAPPGGWPHGPEGLKMVASVFRGGFPDLNFTIDDQMAEGNKVVTRWSATGTQRGELMGIAPTGKRVTVTGIKASVEFSV